MHIMTKDGRIVEGEPLTEQQVFEIDELPKIIGEFPYKYFTKDEQNRMAKYLAEKLEMRKRTEPVVEEEIVHDPEPVVSEFVYPAPVPNSDDPMF